MIECASGSSSPGCLNAKQVAAVKRLMAPATNSKGEVLYVIYIPGTENAVDWLDSDFFGAPSPAYPPRFANMDYPAVPKILCGRENEGQRGRS